VQPGVALTRANAWRPSSALIKLDLPTFDLPANTNSAQLGAGNSRTLGADIKKLAS
jgi:hypothetical protein